MPGTLLGALRPHLTKATGLLSMAPKDILGDLLCPPNLHQDLKINILSQEKPGFKQGSSHLSPTTAALNPPCTEIPGEQHLSPTAHTPGKPGPERLRKLPKEPSARKRPV